MRLKALRSTSLSLLCGALVGLLAVRAPELLVLAVVAGCGLLLGRRPALLLGVFLLVDATYTGTPYYNDIGPLVTTGHQLYEPIKGIPPALLLLSLGLGILVHEGRGLAAAKLRGRGHGVDLVAAILVSLILWTTMLSLAQEAVDFSAGTMLRIATNTLSAVMPWLLALLAYAVAVRMLRLPGGTASFARVVAGALLVKGVLGLLVLLTTGGAQVDGQSNVVYFDAALPMVAGMAIIGFLLTSKHKVPYRKMIVFLAATIVLFSFRRSVWSAIAIAAVMLPLVRQQSVVIRRALATGVVLALALVVLPSDIKRSAFERVGSAVDVAQGTGNEDSARNHKKDVEIGYRLAQANVWLGVGIRAVQDRDFAAQESTKIYVHNDLLQVWLRFGLPGLMLFLMLFAALCWRGLVTLRRGALTVLDAGAAAYSVVLLVPVMTAPFISDSGRWPIVVGVVAAVLRASASRDLTAAMAPPTADAAAVVVQRRVEVR